MIVFFFLVNNVLYFLLADKTNENLKKVDHASSKRISRWQ